MRIDFNIPDDCWINELYNITFKKSINLFIKSFPKLLSGDYTLKKQSDYLDKRITSIHYRKEINTLKKIDLSWDREKIERYIRATSMPNFSPPYLCMDNKKINLILENLK